MFNITFSFLQQQQQQQQLLLLIIIIHTLLYCCKVITSKVNTVTYWCYKMPTFWYKMSLKPKFTIQGSAIFVIDASFIVIE